MHGPTNPILADILRPRRMVFIVNPMSGTKTQRNIRQFIDTQLNHRLFEYVVWETERAGHATELAKKAVAEGFEIVVAVGGDGSVNEVSAGLLDSNVALGIVPAGSGNGLAMHLGYGRDAEAAIRKLNTAEEQIIDVGLLNGRPFVNLAGIGFEALVANLMRGQSSRGFIPYFFRSMRKMSTYEPRTCVIEANGRVISEKCFTVAVANGPMYGYNFSIAPDAKLDDGLFEVVVMKEAPRLGYFAAAAATRTGGIYSFPFVEHFTAEKVTLRCEGEYFAHLDGEGLVAEGELRFEIRAKALRVLRPK